MDYLRTVPDKYFDLACVDPPYGGGGADNDYKGAVVGRFGGRFEKYHLGELSSQNGQVEREARVRRPAAESDRGLAVWENWPDEPGIPRVCDGIPNRVDRIKCLGNAVVPQQFYPFFLFMRTILEENECE